MTTISSVNGTQYKPVDRKDAAIAAAAGYCAYQGSAMLCSRAVAPYLSKMNALNEGIDAKVIKQTIKQAAKDSGTGVIIRDLANVKKEYPTLAQMQRETFEQVRKIAREFQRTKDSDAYNKALKNLVKKNIKNMRESLVITGGNALFDPFKNRILINSKKIGVAGFHEIGHAMNNKSIFGKLIPSFRYVAAGVPIALLATIILKRPKVEGEKPKNTFDKVTEFMKNNAGTISIVAAAPMVTEEIIASVRGAKLAKKICSPKLFKRVIGMNKISSVSYIAGAGITALGLAFARKIVNTMAKPQAVPEE